MAKITAKRGQGKPNKPLNLKTHETNKPFMDEDDSWFTGVSKPIGFIAYYVIKGKYFAIIGAENQHHAFNKARQEFGLNWQYITNVSPLQNKFKAHYLELPWEEFRKL